MFPMLGWSCNYRSPGVTMLRWFHALMPKEDRFFDLFAQHSRAILGGATALRAMLEGGKAIDENYQVVMHGSVHRNLRAVPYRSGRAVGSGPGRRGRSRRNCREFAFKRL